jgi:hypothetical protein
MSPVAKVLVLALCLGLPLVAASTALAKTVRVYGPKIISRDTPLPGSCDGLRQETDTMVAADPNQPSHIVATWDVDDHKSNVTAVSRDGGKSWKITTVPGISKCTGGSSDQVVDPFVSIGAGGAAYFATLPLSLSGFLVSESADGGSTWATPVTADPAAGLTDDLPSVVADQAHNGHVLLTWSRFEYTGSAQTGGDARFSASVDAGQSFSEPVVIHHAPHGKVVLESRLAQMSNGTLLDIFGEAPAEPLTAPQQAFATRSTDGGSTWTAPVRITTVGQDPIIDPDTGKPQYNFCCLFGVATAAGGRAYLAYTKVGGLKSGRVLVAGSTDGGKSWRAPRTVASLRAQAFEPALAVAEDGTVGVTWYDFRHDKRRDKTLTTDYWFAYSRDGGNHWRQRHLAGPFNLRSSRRTGRPLGVYQGLAGLRHGFAATFIEAKPRAKNGSEDVFFARIMPPKA